MEDEEKCRVDGTDDYLKKLARRGMIINELRAHFANEN